MHVTGQLEKKTSMLNGPDERFRIFKIPSPATIAQHKIFKITKKTGTGACKCPRLRPVQTLFARETHNRGRVVLLFFAPIKNNSKRQKKRAIHRHGRPQRLLAYMKKLIGFMFVPRKILLAQ
jgi:hypothetical protein